MMNTEPRQWSPFAELGELQSRINNLLPAFATQGQGHPALLDNGKREPAVDIEEDEKQFTITADIPMVKKEDVSVTIEDGVLNISGEQKEATETGKKTFHRVERFHGSYERSFELPENVDEEGMNATLKDGVLFITLPKTKVSEQKNARQIRVK